eukprot:scaffold25318_cov117-Isochrysis_galbana.AAC.8
MAEHRSVEWFTVVHGAPAGARGKLTAATRATPWRCAEGSARTSSRGGRRLSTGRTNNEMNGSERRHGLPDATTRNLVEPSTGTAAIRGSLESRLWCVGLWGQSAELAIATD